MTNPFEQLVAAVYRRWKSGLAVTGTEHPDDQAMACFLEKRLPAQEQEDLMRHVLSCERCAQRLALLITAEPAVGQDLPEGLFERTQQMVEGHAETDLLELLVICKEKALEIVRTTGDVLVGQELVPAALLRSRQISQFKDSVTVLKDFRDIRVEVKVEARNHTYFDALIIVREKKTQQIVKDLRISLMREGLELESYVTDTGRVSFEHIQLGTYSVEISALKERLATVVIDIKR